MLLSRTIVAVGLGILAFACKTPAQVVAACPDQVMTWMACPGLSAKEGSVCQVYGPPLGCGFDEVALDFANNQHLGREQGLRGRFYIFAIAVTAQGASRIPDNLAPQPSSVVTLDY